MQVEPDRPSRARIVSVVFDEDGFILDANQWTEALAEELAVAADIDSLGPRHWDTIHFIRGKFLSNGALPLMRHVCRQLGMRPHAIKGMFGGCHHLWRIAGLPNPGEEAKSYMD